MASELRVNNIKNRSGLGTVTFADEGLVISGITSLSLGDTSLIVGSASSTGTADQKLQVTGGAYVSGAIGIGTTNPSATLQVNRGSGSGFALPSNDSEGWIAKFYNFNDSSTENGVIIANRWATDASTIFEVGGLYDNANGFDTYLTVTGLGNLGVGAASPAAKTHIAGAASATTELLRLQSNTNSGEGNAVRLAFSSQVALDSSQRVNATIDALTEAVTSTHHGALRFSTMNATTLTERGRFTYGGYFKASNDGTYFGSGATIHEFRQTTTADNVYLTSTNASYASVSVVNNISRAANLAYAFFFGYSGGGGDLEVNLRGDGQSYCDGSWNGGGADYAEYFEWEDGNPDNEDRRGCTVSLVGDKIKIAEEGDIIIGAISGNPSVVGDAAWNKWDGKYLTDDYGSYILEEHNVVEWTDEDGKQHSYEDWNLPNDIIVPEDAVTKTHDEKGNRFTHRKLNPEYNEMLEYIPRENRPEWDAVGMMGKLRIRKGQVVDSRWIKMKDISATVEEWLVR